MICARKQVEGNINPRHASESDQAMGRVVDHQQRYGSWYAIRAP